MHARKTALVRPVPVAPRYRPRDATLRRWRRLESAVAGVVGPGGASALVRHTAARADARLAKLGEAAPTVGSGGAAERLHDLLATMPDETAAVIETALHREFSALLERLLGRTIALRLLENGIDEAAAPARVHHLRPRREGSRSNAFSIA